MFSIRKEDKKIKIALLLIEVMFAIIALVYVLKLGDSTLLGSLEKFDNDDVKYIRSAWNFACNKIISYESVTEPTVYIMPGLTVVLSWFVNLFGKFDAVIAFRVFQVIIQCASLYMVFLIGRKLFNSKVAIIACLINSLYIVEYYVPSLILMETIFKFLLLLLLYLSIYAIERKSMRLYVLAAIVWSLACLFRPTIAAYPAIILLIWILRKEYKLKDMVKYASIVLVIFCIIMAPWWIRNYKLFNTFIPFTASSGNPFLQGTFVHYDKSNGFGVPYEKGANSIESNENEIKAGIERLKIYGKKEPIKYIYWYTLGKTFYFWRAPFYWQGILGFVLALVQHIFIIVSSILGLRLCNKKKQWNINITMILGTIVLFNLVYLPYFTFERYSYPLMSLLSIFSGYAINNLLVKRKNSK
ncbi:MAG: glycosyltransferase family 39 protein [Clostridium sp.]|uniref:ArnT family glycosyltransferase n=1 Tax=Clostridium sp. TaxID=1506 RepID=UPI00290D78C0|nr:glycosyltransferase family 39 protein [Clostridium sp.]MDU5110196.1 glycosyltransferase family 39 protein [Clostridium sp.]